MPLPLRRGQSKGGSDASPGTSSRASASSYYGPKRLFSCVGHVFLLMALLVFVGITTLWHGRQSASGTAHPWPRRSMRGHSLQQSLGHSVAQHMGTHHHVSAARGVRQHEHAVEQGRPHEGSNSTQQQDLPVWWFAPFFDHSSFGKEAATIVLGMIRSGSVDVKKVWIGLPEGTCEHNFDHSLPYDDYMQLEAAWKRADRNKSAIVVCHSLPPMWARPHNSWKVCEPCPPVGYTPALAVGRAMAETDVYNADFVDKSNRMDEVWVPSKFSAQVLAASGVDATKIRIVPIGVNTTWYNPATTQPTKLPIGEPVFNSSMALQRERCEKLKLFPELPTTWYSRWFMPDPPDPCGSPGTETPGHGRRWWIWRQPKPEKPFVFVSTFKWEKRKGWDSLLQAYLEEFTVADNVELYIITKEFMAGSNFKGDIHNLAMKQLGMDTAEKLEQAPRIYVTSTTLVAEQYAGMYKAADCYVSASRGEGWGMPVTEAMSMGLPAIVTNWSGTADFVDDKVGYLVNYTLSQVPDGEPYWFSGAQWADANVKHLRQVMRHVYSNPQEAAAKGKAARHLMVSKYSHELVAKAVATELGRLNAKIRSGKCGSCFSEQYVDKNPDSRSDDYLQP